MDLARHIKGLELPEAVSFEQRFGLGAWDREDAGSTSSPGTGATRKKGNWVNKAGEIIQVLPDLYCTIFPKKCRQQSSNPAPVVVQQSNQRDWLTVSLLVVVVLVLLILIFKK